MEIVEIKRDRKTLLAGAAAIALIAGIGGVMIGRSGDSSPPAEATVDKGEGEEGAEL